MISDNHPQSGIRFVSFPITGFERIKRQMLTWAASHHSGAGVDICCFLDNQGYTAGIPSRFECLLAVGARDRLEATAGDAFLRLRDWSARNPEWIFGHLSYALTAETEPIPPDTRSPVPPATPSPVPPGISSPVPPGTSSPVPPDDPDPIGFPDLFFFIPEILIELDAATIRIGSFGDDQASIWQQIRSTSIAVTGPGSPAHPKSPAHPGSPDLPTAPIPPFKARISRDEYLETIGDLRRHIRRGDCYEINFCQEFYSQPACLDPLAAWWALSRVSPNPFSAFYRLGSRYLLCASPERYLQKTGPVLLSQPIKGTLARPGGGSGGSGRSGGSEGFDEFGGGPGESGPVSDQAAADALFHSAKDRSENVMIVDLVRNDLSRVCRPGSVAVGELYGIYPFPQVFQMISTISGVILPGLDWADALRATFPMGSMTGAPKNRVVRLIRQYERSHRGIFSGAVGYVTPGGDFDFNVVIRSLMYNAESRYLSYQVGSGITWYSDPVAEYEECLVKARGIMKALGMLADRTAQ